jgi:hypothetical protein
MVLDNLSDVQIANALLQLCHGQATAVVLGWRKTEKPNNAELPGGPQTVAYLTPEVELWVC